MTKSVCSSQWYLAQLKPNCGSIALRNLQRQGFECFLPLERRTCRRANRLSTVTSAYFPGYLFVSVLPDSAPWRAIRSTHGVARLVSFGPQPAPVPAHIVTELMQSCDADGCIRPQLEFAEGDGVCIAHGPLASFIGRIDRLAPEERAWVLLDIMGKETRVSVPKADLRLAARG